MRGGVGLESGISWSHQAGFLPQLNHVSVDSAEAAMTHFTPFLDQMSVHIILSRDPSLNDISYLGLFFKDLLILGFQL